MIAKVNVSILPNMIPRPSMYKLANHIELRATTASAMMAAFSVFERTRGQVIKRNWCRLLMNVHVCGFEVCVYALNSDAQSDLPNVLRIGR